MTRTTAIGLLALSCSRQPSWFSRCPEPGPPGRKRRRPRSENGTLSLRFPEPGSAVLTNKLTGRSYALSAEPFVLLARDRREPASGDGRGFRPGRAANVSPALLRFATTELAAGEARRSRRFRARGRRLVCAQTCVRSSTGSERSSSFTTPPSMMSVSSRMRSPQGPEPRLSRRPGVLGHGVADRRGGDPGRPVTPDALPGRLGRSWRILDEQDHGRRGVVSGGIEEAFGATSRSYRANRVDFATFYFDWLCHEQLRAAPVRNPGQLRGPEAAPEMYGLQFDIYNSDAGLVESQGRISRSSRPASTGGSRWPAAYR